ncbi:MAG: glycosyltransferase family 4 protein [Armatimonadota bacterium]|nr:glycosyltransferase family 4 protein [Armatimonadota bacterium]
MTPPVQIIHIVRESAGGMRKHVLHLLTALDRERFRLSLVAPQDFTAAALKQGLWDMTCVDAQIGDALGPRSVIALPRILKLARGTPSPRIIHAHGYAAALYASAVALLSGSKLVYTAHNALSSEASAITRAAARIASRRAARIIAVSEGVKKSLQTIGVPAAKITVIANGVDAGELPADFDRSAKLAELDVPADSKIVLCVARLTPVKGVRYLVEAVSALRKAIGRCEIVVAGDGPEMESLRELDRRLNGSDGVVFLGHRDDIPELLAVADAVAVPSVQEGQGLVALEAMAAGKPVVATAVGGLVETIRDGVTGLLAAPEDPGALAEGLARVLSDPELARSLGDAGIRFVRKEMTVEKMIAATEDVYLQCIEA